VQSAPIQFHANAANAFNEKASELLPLIAQAEDQPPTQAPSRDIPVAVTLTEEDIRGEVIEVALNGVGKKVGRFFRKNGRRYGLTGDAYQRLADLAERIAGNTAVRGRLGQQYVEKALLDWLQEAYGAEEVITPFTDALIARAANDVEPITVWVPISGLYIEEDFRLGVVTFSPLTRTKFDAWGAQVSSAMAPFLNGMRLRIQGRAAAVIELTCERDYAFAAAVEEARIATSYLAIYSAGARLPQIRCPITALGTQRHEQATALYEKDGRLVHTANHILEAPAHLDWTLSKATVERLRRGGLDTVSGMLSKPSRTAFEETVLSAILIYSKAAFSADPVEKIVYVLSALESVLLRNESESIQQNLGERIAFFIGQSLADRKVLIQQIKAIYGIRSRYLHHGHRRSELDVVESFLTTAWLFFVNLIANAPRFATKEAFVAAIEDRKLS
jgi:hypothetical protein